ncbi:3-dehydroquinate dehydratase, type I, variant [Exophiala oligosperma]|uniref:3-dehydroquinate dehydratase, type I n=1 Tax=Exophiala oligosperma TaxID=215243 RepID=A0A0D2B0Y9_9EURO|nr:3-dehydroquinate dehydratase, type I [Exophiala oligosperma]XP_016266018.1 3-dehydroquinate dehydratase, type I, variant [Exophiala oligosperma]KIW45801.1 3-dehydroquinate dehydratase, type I [Exophiala oligosperma]KIW45802.1 3-dehydroquinate dehydratase, type I, variant [Exophiala oligosperma]
MASRRPANPTSTSSSDHRRGSLQEHPIPDFQTTLRHFDSRASIALVGVRGAGKRSLGFIAATHLGRKFISDGLYFEEVTGLSKAAYLHRYGKAEFQTRALAIFQYMLAKNPQDCVIDCGMISVAAEAHELLRHYSQTHPVIHIIRNYDHLSRHLQLGEQQARYLKETDLRLRECSNMEFYNLYDSTCVAETETSAEDFNQTSSFVLQKIKIDIQAYVDFILARDQSVPSSPFSQSALFPERKTRSYISFIRLSAMKKNPAELDWAESGEDAVELCIDTWEPGTTNDIAMWISKLRRQLGIRIVVSLAKSGTESSSPSHEAYWEMIRYILRLAVDYIVIDFNIPWAIQKALLSSKGQTRTIAEIHLDPDSPSTWLGRERQILCEKAQNLGYDLVRVTQFATSRQDNQDSLQFAIATSQTLKIPIIAYNLGYLGRTSKVFNKIMTPVKRHEADITNNHGDIPEAGVWLHQVCAALFQCFEYDPLHFHVLGELVSFSRAPAMYTVAFRLYGMRHEFSYRDVSTFDEILTLARDHFFGGAALSYPYKEIAFKACTVTSPHASVIGSVNTIMPLRQLPGHKADALAENARLRNRGGPVVGFYGDNSDWEGLYNNIRRRLSPRNTAACSRGAGLVLGAGGSSRSAVYALLRLGCQTVYVYNRTHANAVKLAAHFNTWCQTREGGSGKSSVVILEPEGTSWPQGTTLPTIIVSCVPISVSLFGDSDLPLQLPEEWLGSPSGGVVADISYNPPETPLLKQIKSFRESTGYPWAIVNGVDVVYEQAILQFEQFTGYRAPRQAMKDALKV